MQITTAKSCGIHYTPPELARFLAQRVASRLARRTGPLRVLDPACGDGALLAALAHARPQPLTERLHLVGYETDPAALDHAARSLAGLALAERTLIEGDFLTAGETDDGPRGFDAVIANPPYVRTQVLGAHRAGRLAKKFGLTGRVDLYYAFALAMAQALRPGGVLGLLVSNRFLSIKSGVALRAMLRSQFRLEAVYDLGDTKLFAAAVLPAIIIATKNDGTSAAGCRFDRVYGQPAQTPAASRPSDPRSDSTGNAAAAATNADADKPLPAIRQVPSILAALGDDRTAGLVQAPTGLFQVERGFLSERGPDRIWTLASRQSQAWLRTVQRFTATTFGDVGRVRVGIKTTADEVFIRDDWHSLPEDRQPEPELLRPLLRHFSAARWIAGQRRQTLLYPHRAAGGRRQAIDLAAFPRASRYLTSHRARLSRRTYLTDSGRQWYEIWVPHHPALWSLPKIVFPDIAAQGRFFYDRSGTLVNGDCYWITLDQGRDLDWLLLMLAVANSSFILRYYDLVFHNKLYAGRRRFMTQYVKQFPLPRFESPAAQEAIAHTRQLVGVAAACPTPFQSAATQPIAAGGTCADAELEREVDRLIWRAFGLAAPDGA